MRGPDDFDRPAIVSGRFRFEALAPSDYPAVGDWVTLADDPAATRTDEPADHHRRPPPSVRVRPKRGRREPAVGGPPRR